jgi:hypothetical protein
MIMIMIMKHPWGGRVRSDKQEVIRDKVREGGGALSMGGGGGGQKGRGQLVNNHL